MLSQLLIQDRSILESIMMIVLQYGSKKLMTWNKFEAVNVTQSWTNKYKHCFNYSPNDNRTSDCLWNCGSNKCYYEKPIKCDQPNKNGFRKCLGIKAEGWTSVICASFLCKTLMSLWPRVTYNLWMEQDNFHSQSISYMWRCGRT